MQLQYKKTKRTVMITERKAKHVEPHLHNALEMVYVTEGSLELGMGTELFHMEKGDIGFIFPDVIHHYQVFGEGRNRAYYIQVLPNALGILCDCLQKFAPQNPVVKHNKISKEVGNAMDGILHASKDDEIIIVAYMQIILAKCMSELSLVDKQQVGSTDLVYQTVEYISGHFKEAISLESMAKELGVSKYVLSRLFSKTFHRNFSQYLNDTRINHAIYCLETTNDSVIYISMESGFNSQRSFNRVFKERYHMTPSEYRNNYKKAKQVELI